ncbi:MAG: helix-turn-helix domain-containing protein [Bacteroidota bacterium]|nr:helix-turn-helix domain-containing protein [Bacteroidota bacterium]
MNDPEVILYTIGDKLTQLRIKSGHASYETFAIEHKLSRMQYWRMENGKTNMTIKSLVRILKIHNLTPAQFFRKEKF